MDNVCKLFANEKEKLIDTKQPEDIPKDKMRGIKRKSKNVGGKYSCEECDYKPNKASNLRRHVEAIHNGIYYPCSKCDFKTADQGSLKNHVESIHYSCSQCEHKATEKASLKKHVESVHGGVQYPCSQCEYKATCLLYTSPSPRD